MAIGAADLFGDPARILDPRRPFGDRREEGGEVDLLKALAVAVAARDVADEQDHRGRILAGDMHSGTGVSCARSPGDESDSGPAGHLAVGVGHVGDAAFLPTDDCVDLRRVGKRVEDREKAFAGNREDAVATLDPELVDEDAAAGSGACAIGHAAPLACRSGCVMSAEYSRLQPEACILPLMNGNAANPTPMPRFDAFTRNSRMR